MSRKDDPGFIKLIQEHVSLDEETGRLTFTKLYANLCLNFGWKNKIIVVPYAHVVWLLKNNRWPVAGMHLDHINDNPQDNRPCNLQELTEEESQKKRRGRMVYRSYGTGKYGYGMGITYDKRDGRYYISRHLSRGHGSGELKTIKRSLGGADTIEEAEAKVAKYIEEIKANGLAYLPENPEKNPKKATIELNNAKERLRSLRKDGLTIREISRIAGLREGAVYSRIKDIGIDKRLDSHPVKLTKDKVGEIRALRKNGYTLQRLADKFGVSKTMVSNIVNGRAWASV